MAAYEFCKVGGQEGILVSVKELQTLAKAMDCAYRDKYIPIPGMSTEDQVELIKEKEQDPNWEPSFEDAVYWETKRTGSHGWCCQHTGKVIQWG